MLKERWFVFISLIAIVMIGAFFLVIWKMQEATDRLEQWQEAVLTGNQERIVQLLDQGIPVDTNVEIKKRVGDVSVYEPATALVIASAFHDIELVKLLLDRGADPNSNNSSGHTPLSVAAARNSPQLIGVLVDAEADLELAPKVSVTPLITAAFYDNSAALKALIEFGALVNAQDDHIGTALMHAANIGSVINVRALLDAGADVSITDDSGRNAFLMAASSGNAEVMKLLLEYGADSIATTTNGYTALIYASGNLKSSDAVRFLLEMGVDPNQSSNVPNWKGLAPLHEAAEYGNVEIVKLLLEAGADPQAATEHGFTPISRAEERDDDLKEEIISLLNAEIEKRKSSSD